MTETTIFTPNVLSHISKFIKTDLCGDRIPDFNIGDIYIFEKLMHDAENGQTDFDISIDTDDIVKDSDAYESLLNYIFEGYYFANDYRYVTRLTLKIDKEAKTLEVGACLGFTGWSGPSSNGDEFIVHEGECILLDDYVEGMKQSLDEDDYRDEEDLYEKARSEFIDSSEFDPSSTYVSTVISLES